jgi:hypothetical protein
VLIHLNYTFSFPNKWLYTLFKGITVTSSFVRVSSVSLHGRAPLHAMPFVSPFYGALYTSDVLTCGTLFWRMGATERVAPSVRKHLRGLNQSQEGSETSIPVSSPNACALMINVATDRAAPSAPKPREAMSATGKFQNPRVGYTVRYL